MSVAEKMARREVIAAGGLTLLAGAILGATRARQSSGTDNGLGLAAGGRVVTVTPPYDPMFETRLDTLFPGLSHDARFQAIAPASCLVTNSAGPAIIGLSLVWSMQTASGVAKKNLQLFRRAGHMSDGKRSLMTGQADLLRSGETLLVTPLFFWSPRAFQKHRKGALRAPDKLNKSGLQSGMFLELKNGANVDVSLVTVVHSDWKKIGTDTTHLARNIAIRRRAESEEAAAVLKVINARGNSSDVFGVLMQHQTVEGVAGEVIPADNKFRHLYWQTRATHAKRLLRHFNRLDPSSFIAQLTATSSRKDATIQLIRA
jgi:hypothetical protein